MVNCFHMHKPDVTELIATLEEIHRNFGDLPIEVEGLPELSIRVRENGEVSIYGEYPKQKQVHRCRSIGSGGSAPSALFPPPLTIDN